MLPLYSHIVIEASIQFYENVYPTGSLFLELHSFGESKDSVVLVLLIWGFLLLDCFCSHLIKGSATQRQGK